MSCMLNTVAFRVTTVEVERTVSARNACEDRDASVALEEANDKHRALTLYRDPECPAAVLRVKGKPAYCFKVGISAERVDGGDEEDSQSDDECMRGDEDVQSYAAKLRRLCGRLVFRFVETQHEDKAER